MVEFRVLRCAHCLTFQVLQVTKSPKWKCKLCGEKQSVLKEYGRGTGADCRRHVQKLNSLRMEIDTAAENSRLDAACNGTHSNSDQKEDTLQGNCVNEQRKSSHWEAYLDTDVKDENGTDANEVPGKAFDDDERHGKDVYVTTDWSTFELDPKLALKNKRKIHERSKWSKRAKYGDQKYECLNNDSSDTQSASYRSSKYVEFSQKQNKSFPSSSLNHGNHSKFNSMPDSYFSIKPPLTNRNHEYVTRLIENEERTTNLFNNGDSKRTMSNKDSAQKDFMRSKNIPLSATPSSVKSKGSGTKGVSPKLQNSTSKWSAFVTDTNDEDDTDDYSDNESSHQEFNSNLDFGHVSSASRFPSVPESGKLSSVPSAISRWNTFIKDKGLDDREKDEVGDDVNLIYKENSGLNREISSIKHCHSSPNQQVTSQLETVKDEDCDLNREMFVGKRVPNTVKCLSPRANRQGPLNKAAMFQIDDNDHEAWDIDL